jgi:HSP20 family molecular chaperone IbpA
VNAPRPAKPPLATLSLLRREINQMLARLGELDSSRTRLPGEWSPDVDVYESHGRIVVVVEVPGLPPESLRVAWREGELVVSGERRPRRAAASGFLCMERPTGRFARGIPLDAPVNLNEAQARLSRGLLVITLPRVSERRRRETQIPIERDQEE